MTLATDTLFPLDEIPEPSGTRHAQVLVKHGDRAAEVDEAIADLILELWRADLDTFMSCQDAPTGWVWIMLPATSANRLLEIIRCGCGPEGEDLCRRALEEWPPVEAPMGSRYRSNQSAWEGDTWRYDPWAHFISVRFPTDDYRPVLRSLRAHNSSPSDERMTNRTHRR
jgi:hypothetical protein